MLAAILLAILLFVVAAYAAYFAYTSQTQILSLVEEMHDLLFYDDDLEE